MEEGAEGCQEGQAGPPDDLTTPDPARVVAPHETRHRIAAIAEYVGAALAALWLSRSFWLPGRYVVAFDTVAYTGPNYEITLSAWRSGRIPLWNEFIYGGVTHLGNPQAAVFSPTKVIGLLFETNRAMGVTVAFHLVLMAVGTVMLLRRLGAAPPAGLAAALVMVANGAVLTRSIQFEQITVLAWTPLLLCAIASVAQTDRRSWLAISGLAAVTTMVLVGGHPQILYQVALLAAAWAVALTVRRPALARIGDLLIGVALGVLAASIHLVAAVAATRDSAVSGGRAADDDALLAFAVRPEYLVQTLLGSVRGVDEVIFAGGFEAIGHVGVAAAFLGVIGTVLMLRDPARRPIGIVLAVAAVVAVIWALGPRTPLFTVAYDFLPGFDFSRAFGRWVNVTAVCVAIASGLAVDHLGRRLPDLAARLTATAVAATMFVVALVLGVFDLVVLPDRSTLIPWALTAVAVAVLVATVGWHGRAMLVAVALTLVVGLELASTSRYSPIDISTTDTAFDAWPAGPATGLANRAGLTVAFTNDDFSDIEYLIGGVRPNVNVLAGAHSLDGYDGGVQVTRRYAALLDRLTGDGDTELALRNQLPMPLAPSVAAQLGIRDAVVDNRRDVEAMLPGWADTGLRDNRFTVWENPAWTGDAIARVAGSATPQRLPMDQPSPERIVVRTDGLGPAAVTVHRQSAPGWRVRVDGEPADIIERDGFFLGVDLDAGASEIVFDYRPWWLPAALAASGIGTVGIGVLACAGAIRRRSLRFGHEPTDEEDVDPPSPGSTSSSSHA